jgi:hypothetical protein
MSLYEDSKTGNLLSRILIKNTQMMMPAYIKYLLADMAI